MRYLLDTHIILWWLSDPKRLNRDQLTVLQDSDASIFISVVSVLEISIKASIGKLQIEDDYLTFLKNDRFEFLPIQLEDADLIKSLPLIHRDPFDRLLIAQAINNDFTIITKDSYFRSYDVKILMN